MELNNNVKLRPLGARVLVKPEKVDEKSKGGVYIPDTASKERPQAGLVLAVGPGKVDDNGKRVAMDVKVHDKIIFSKYAGTEIKIGTEDHLILAETDILAITE